MTVDHECPWVGQCRCVEDESLCTCGHQKSDHASIPASELVSAGWYLFAFEDEPAERTRCEMGIATDIKFADPCPCSRFEMVTS